MSTTSCVEPVFFLRYEQTGERKPIYPLSHTHPTLPQSTRTCTTPTVTSRLVSSCIDPGVGLRPFTTADGPAGAAAAGGAAARGDLLLVLLLLSAVEEGRMRAPRSPFLTKVRVRNIQRPSSVRVTIHGTLCEREGGEMWVVIARVLGRGRRRRRGWVVMS